MSIKRAPRPDTNFYLLDKRISEDERLSWEARGLLVFLLGKPDHWEVSIQHLVNETKGAIRKKTGRDGVYAIMRELAEAGYLSRGQARKEGGSFGSTDYVVHEQPHTENPDTVQPQPASPDTDKPDTAEPYTADPTQASIENPVRTEGEARIDPAPGDEPPAPDAIQGELVPADPPQAQAEDQPRIEIPADMPGPKDRNAKTFKAWTNYAFAYRARYGVWPLWNAKCGGQIAQVIDRVGADLAPKVTAYYLHLNQAFYVAKMHALGPLVADCESIATQMATNRQMTTTQARQADSSQSNLSAADEAIRMLRERRAVHGS